MAALRSLIRQVSQNDKRAELTAKLLELRNARRAAWLQFVAATFVLIGAGTAAWVTFGQIDQAQQQNRITLEGQLTDRYTKAIDQLGRREADVRLGGIFALERIARDSPKDRLTIYEVLTAYVRGHSPWPPSQPGQLPASRSAEEISALQVRAPDVQSALSVLARRTVTTNDPALDLNKTDLRMADLREAQLQGANLREAQLQGANLIDAQLQGADLLHAQLQGADFRDAQLQDAFFSGAKLQRANLTGAQLQYADLLDAQVQGAFLLGAQLQFADLRGAQLRGAHLGRAQLQGANLIDAQLQGALLFHADLREAQLQGADLRVAQLQGAQFRAKDSTFADANLKDAKLQGARTDAATQWPNGFRCNVCMVDGP